MDPRNYQIITLSAFVLVGVTRLGFQIDWLNALVIIGVALLAQCCLFAAGQAKSALISSLSLVLLLRTDLALVAGIAALLAIRIVVPCLDISGAVGCIGYGSIFSFGRRSDGCDPRTKTGCSALFFIFLPGYCVFAWLVSG